MKLNDMLAKPGIYLISAPRLFFFAEVLAGGECHQLKPDTFERDGVLNREGWKLTGEEEIFGPLARPGTDVGTLKITVKGSMTTIDVDWGDAIYELPPGEYPLNVGGKL